MATISGVWIISEESYTNVAVSEKITYPVNFKIDLSQSEEYYATHSLFSKDFVSIQLRPTNNDFMRIDTSNDYGVIYSTTLPIALDFGTGQTVDDELYAWLTENATGPEPEQPAWQFNLRDFLSGMASAAASRGVLKRRTNGVQIPNNSKGTALISVGTPITDLLPYMMGYQIGCILRAQRAKQDSTVQAFMEDGVLYIINAEAVLAKDVLEVI